MIEFFSRRFQPPADGTHDEAGIAMLVAVMIVMLMTLIPLAMFSQSVQQLPLRAARPRPRDGAGRGRGRRRRLPQSLGAEPELLDVQPDQPSADRGFELGRRLAVGWHVQELGLGSGSGTSNEQFKYNVNTTQTRRRASCTSRRPDESRNVVRTVKVGLRRQGFLDYLWLTDYEITDPALSGGERVELQVSTCGSGTRASKLRTERSRDAGRVLDSTGGVERAGALERRSLCVWLPTFDGDTDTYYNSATSKNVSTARSSVVRAPC